MKARCSVFGYMLKSLFVMMLTGICAAPVAIAGPTTLTIASLLGKDKPETRVWVRIGELLEERLPGAFELRIVTDAALGGEREVAEGVRLGSIHGSLSTLANMSSWVPEAGVFDMPFMFRDAEHIDAVMNGPIGEAFRNRFREQGYRVLGYIDYGARHLLAKQPITLPGEVEGRRIRVIESALHAGLWRSLGAQPTPIPIPEVYNALQTGVVDLMDLTKSAYVGFRLHEVVPYLIETGHISALGVIYIAEDFFQRLDEQQQRVLLEIGAEAASYFNRIMAEDHTRSMEQALAEGARTVNVDRAVWRTAVAPFRDAFAERTGVGEWVRRIVDTEAAD